MQFYTVPEDECEVCELTYIDVEGQLMLKGASRSTFYGNIKLCLGHLHLMTSLVRHGEVTVCCGCKKRLCTKHKSEEDSDGVVSYSPLCICCDNGGTREYPNYITELKNIEILSDPFEYEREQYLMEPLNERYEVAVIGYFRDMLMKGIPMLQIGVYEFNAFWDMEPVREVLVKDVGRDVAGILMDYLF